MAEILVSICKGDTCVSRGGDALHAEVDKQVSAAGLGERVRVKRGGCYGLCKLGPNLIVREGV